MRKTTILERLLGFAITLVLVLVIFIVFVNRWGSKAGNREETMGRVLCIAYLRDIADALKEKNIELTEKNILAIEEVLGELGLWCPSGNKIHSDVKTASYTVVVLESGEIVITENADNHNIDKMKNVKMPYIRYCLYRPSGDANEIKRGRWTDRSLDFEKIEPQSRNFLR